MPGVDNFRIKTICDKITDMPPSELTAKQILNYELLYKALKEPEIDYSLLAKYSKPCEWFEDIAMKCANEEWFTCDKCWEKTLQAVMVENDAKSNYEFPEIVNLENEEESFIENYDLYPDDVIMQEELAKYKATGISPEELKIFLDIFKWNQFKDINLLMQMAQEVMEYRG